MKIIEVGASRGEYDCRLELEEVMLEVNTNTFTEELTMSPKVARHLIEAIKEVLK